MKKEIDSQIFLLNLQTGKSLSEALIFASIIPQYDNRLFMELPRKLQAQNMGRTCSALVVFMVIP